ncbi:hypothetical protein hrd7_03390 [Leptolinea sp. HRD-7]|nr:hypothetical protein hrd7_03390 [Leptolinea sp. HRD-7]
MIDPSGSATEIPWPTFTLQPTTTATLEDKKIQKSEPSTPTLTQTETITATASATKTATSTTTATATTTTTAKPPCLIPLTPPEGTGFDAFGKISFSWTSNIEAASYVVAVTAPNGTVMTFPSKSNEYSRWIESFAWGGEFSWQVLALDAEGNVLCRSVPVTFKKPVTEPSLTAVPQGRDPEKSKCIGTLCS